MGECAGAEPIVFRSAQEGEIAERIDHRVERGILVIGMLGIDMLDRAALEIEEPMPGCSAIAR